MPNPWKLCLPSRACRQVLCLALHPPQEPGLGLHTELGEAPEALQPDWSGRHTRPKEGLCCACELGPEAGVGSAPILSREPSFDILGSMATSRGGPTCPVPCRFPLAPAAPRQRATAIAVPAGTSASQPSSTPHWWELETRPRWASVSLPRGKCPPHPGPP